MVKLKEKGEFTMTPNQKWRNDNRDKCAAHWLVQSAIEQGRLLKQPCSECGATGRIHAHHEDYTKPLDIIWLCGKCHNILHARKSGKRIWSEKPAGTPRPGCKKYQPAPKREVGEAEALRMRMDGMSYPEIARAIGVSTGSVYRWINNTHYQKSRK